MGGDGAQVGSEALEGRGEGSRGRLVSGRFPELEQALVERVRELRLGRPLRPLTIVVGSSALRTRVGDLLVRELGAVANVEVVTLLGWARALHTRHDGAPPATPSALVRERLLRGLVERRAARGGLAYFAPVRQRPHFAQALAATFTDLRQALVPPGSGWAAAALVSGAGEERAAGADAARAADLEALYADYCAELRRRGLCDDAEVYGGAAAAAGETPPGAVAAPGAGELGAAAAPGVKPVPAAHTIVYGVYDLNAAQERLVAAALAAGADVLVPLPRGGDAESAAALGIARAAGLPERRIAPPDALFDRDLVAAVWQRRARGWPLRFAGDGTLAVVSVADERAEVREAARAVLAAVEGGARLHECAVVVPHGEEVERYAAGLRAAGLRLACRLPDRSVGVRTVRRLADCLAPAAGEPFARAAVVELLTAAPVLGVGASARESALWLDEARRAGVVAGAEGWGEPLRRRRRGLERELAAAEARGAAAEADLDEDDDGSLEAARTRLAAACGLEAAAGALLRAAGRLPARAGWAAWAGALATLVAEVFEPEPAEAAADVIARLRALDVLGEEVDAAEAARVLREQADGGVTEGRVGRDGVAVVTPLELRGLSFHTVVFAGLAEGGFPARGHADPLLGDAPRARLAEARGWRLPLAAQRESESLLLFAFACEAARERLTLLAPRSDAATGRPRLPSRLLLRLASQAAARPVSLDEFLTGAPLGGVWRHVGGSPAYTPDATAVWLDARERDTAALLLLSADGVAGARQYLAAVLGDPAAARRRLADWAAAHEPAPGAWDGLLGEEARAALAARHPFDAEMHPTRLERYLECPFAFLLRDVLGMRAPEESGEGLEMEPKDFGTLVHRILQATYEAVIAGGLGRDAALERLLQAWEEACAAAEREGVTGAALAWEVRRALLYQDLHAAVSRDPVFEPGGGRPALVEWRFGAAAGAEVALELPGGRGVRFAGRADRVDVTPRGARVVDYKTGGGAKEKERMKRGLGVQLPVYQLAVRQAGAEEYDEIACEYRFVTRRAQAPELAIDADEEKVAARLLRLVAAVVELVDAGVFARAPAGQCGFCDVRYACGSTAWARARHREHEALAPLVELQKRGPGEGGDDDAG